MQGFAKGFLAGTAAWITCFAGYRHFSRKSDDIEIEKLKHDSPFLEDVKQLETQREILKYGIPDRGPYVRTYANHVLAYDYSKRTPIWVAEYLTTDNIKGTANRKNSKFRPDPSVPVPFTAHNSDYIGSGWSRGHMAPAGDSKISQAAMNETFYLTNIVPQNLENNAGFWNRFEMYCRDLVDKYKQVRIITGPLMLPTTDAANKKSISYQLIGNSEVAIPTHLFKIITAENDNTSKVAVAAFVVPNIPIGYDKKLTDYQVQLNEIENRAGITFLPNLSKEKMQDLCTVDSCKLLKKDEFELMFIHKKIQSANTTERLDKIWKELKDKNVKPTDNVMNIYLEKKRELERKEAKKAEL